MSKYNFELDLDTENSLKVIISMIKPKSKILEFGPANGRLTKYLSEKMECKVDIVEIDEEAGVEASKYSERSCMGEELGDIEKFKWLEELKNEKYDYIIFADVLEHLHAPLNVLKSCNKVLKDNGSIIMSIPNIAHNSVIIDLVNDEFKYNEIGLLDNTHISFFTYKSLKRMIQDAEYKAVNEKATYCKVGENEIINSYDSVSKEISKGLRAREKGNIYQFVFEIKKKEYTIIEMPVMTLNCDENSEYELICYIKEKEDDVYSELKTIRKFIKPKHNIIEFKTIDFKDIQEIRIDPININCVIDIKKIYTIIEDKKVNLDIASTNASNIYNGIYIFKTNDPQIYLNVKGMKIDVLYFECTFIDYDNINVYEEIEAIITCKEKQIEQLQNDLIEKAIYIEQLKIVNKNYNVILNSASWKITRPIREGLDFIKKLLKVNRYTRLFCKGLKSSKENGIKYTLERVKQKVKNDKDYNQYAKYNILTDKERQVQIKTKFSKDIKFTIVVPLYNTPENFLCEMIDSCINQTYVNWELCLADGSDDLHSYVNKIVSDYKQKDSRIKYKALEKNGGISENTNECIKMATGEYIALFDHDDILHSSALFEYMKVICDLNADFIYCDEDKFEKDINVCFDAYFKPDFAIDNLRANNYICHFTVFKANLLNIVGMFRKEFDGSQDHDMVLRLTEKAKNIVHIPRILYHWRVSSNSVAADPYAKPYTIEAGIGAVKEHLERYNLKSMVESSKVHPNIYRIRYEIKGNPLISILIPNKDHVIDLSRCVNSILEKSTYKNIEIIIIENNSVEKQTLEYYNELEKYNNVKIVTYQSNGKFNYPSINNFGVTHAKGEHLLFLNNDIDVISENWLEEMLMYSQREDIGAVGAKLYYPNDTIQHAGVILGLGGVAGHSHKHFNRVANGYFSRCAFQQNVTAVTAACLMMKKSIFHEIKGFDEVFAVAFNDVDLCMRIRRAGYLIALTPYAELYHYESISRGYEDTPEKQERFNNEIKLFKTRWKEELVKGDPYYNVNLTVDREDFSLR